MSIGRIHRVSTFRVLMVCTANYCRSPIAEQLLAAKARGLFGKADTWVVESAGTQAWESHPIHELSAQVLAERDALLHAHRSRQLDASIVRDADLILTAERQHRSVVVRLLPAAIGRTFTMLQFARLAAAVEPISGTDAGDLGRQLVVEAKAARATLQPVAPDQDDVVDPMGGPIEAFHTCAATLDAAMEAILRPLRLSVQVS